MSFGLVTEGPTDQIVIRNILAAYFNSADIDTRPLQPKTKSEVAGWPKVLDYLKSDEFKGSFDFVDYVVIQIDTDRYYDWQNNGISIPDSNEKSEDTVIKQIEKVKELFISLMSSDFYQTKKENIIFAISVQSIECWLLPFYFGNKDIQAKKIANCMKTLNTYLKKKYGFVLHQKMKQEPVTGVSYYEIAAKEINVKSKLNKCYGKNPSLKIFVENLKHLCPTAEII